MAKDSQFCPIPVYVVIDHDGGLLFMKTLAGEKVYLTYPDRKSAEAAAFDYNKKDKDLFCSVCEAKLLLKRPKET